MLLRLCYVHHHLCPFLAAAPRPQSQTGAPRRRTMAEYPFMDTKYEIPAPLLVLLLLLLLPPPAPLKDIPG